MNFPASNLCEIFHSSQLLLLETSPEGNELLSVLPASDVTGVTVMSIEKWCKNSNSLVLLFVPDLLFLVPNLQAQLMRFNCRSSHWAAYMQICRWNVQLSEGRLAVLPERERCLVRSPSGKLHVLLEPPPHLGRAQGQHLRRVLSAALTLGAPGAPVSCRLAWLSPGHPPVGWCMGLCSPVSKGSPPSSAAGTGGTVLRLSLCRASAGSGSATQRWAGLSLFLDCPFPINCRCYQRVSWLGFCLVLLLQENTFSSCFSPPKWSIFLWIRADLTAGGGWLLKPGSLPDP